MGCVCIRQDGPLCGERPNPLLINMYSCSLIQFSLNLFLTWYQSLHAVNYLLNLLPTKAISAPSPTLLFSAPLPPTPTYGSSGAPATRTPLSLIPTTSPLAPVSVSFLGTPLSTRGTGVSISAQTVCWSLGTSSSTSHPSPLPPPAHLLTTWRYFGA
jgi:hypothetical protein